MYLDLINIYGELFTVTFVYFCCENIQKLILDIIEAMFVLRCFIIELVYLIRDFNVVKGKVSNGHGTMREQVFHSILDWLFSGGDSQDPRKNKGIFGRVQSLCNICQKKPVPVKFVLMNLPEPPMLSPMDKAEYAHIKAQFNVKYKFILPK